MQRTEFEYQRRWARPWVAAGMMGLLLSGAVSAAGFETQHISLGHPANGSLLRLPERPILIASGHDSENRWCSWVDTTTGAAKQIPIPSTGQFFTSARIVGQAQSQLVALTGDGIWRFDEPTVQWQLLVTVPSMYPVVDKKRFRLLALDVDVNNDQRTDFLIPDFTGYHLLIQQADGQFSRFDLPVDAEAQLFMDGPMFEQKQPLLVDANGDGRLDIGFALDDSIRWYLQQADGGFPNQALVQPLGIGLTPDLQAQQRGGDGRSFSNLVIRRLLLAKDLNNDQRPDLVVQRQLYVDAMDQRYTYEVFYGKATEPGALVSYAAKPDQQIATQGVQFEVGFTDFDQDGLLDFATPSAEIGISKIVRALLTGSAGVDYFVYKQQADGSFGRKPVFSTELTAQVAINAGQVNMPVIATLKTKSGAAGLAIGDDEAAMAWHEPVAAKVFSSKSTRVKAPMPTRGTLLLTTDLNGDQADDLVLAFGQQERKPEWANQLLILRQVP